MCDIVRHVPDPDTGIRYPVKFRHPRAFFNIQAGGGGNAPQSPPCAPPPPPPPHEITFCPPRKSPFFLNLYKQTSED